MEELPKCVAPQRFFKIVSLVLLCCVMGISVPSFAGTGPGCYVNGVLYTSVTSKGGTYFYRNTGTVVSPCGLGFQSLGGTGACRLFDGGNEGANGSYTYYATNYSADWEQVPCPIDDHVFLFLLLPIVGFTIFKLRLNKML